MSDIKENIEKFIDSIKDGNYNEAQDIFGGLIGDKLDDRLEAEKIAVAGSIFNGDDDDLALEDEELELEDELEEAKKYKKEEDEEEDDDDDDEDDDEDDDDDDDDDDEKEDLKERKPKKHKK